MLNYAEEWIPQRADPFILHAENGKYYFTASVPEYDRVVLRCADSLEGIKDAEEKTIWKKHESGIMSCNVWAPELHYLFGGWYMYFAASDKDDIWALRPYVLKCCGDDPMNDEWVELGKMNAAPDDEFSFRAFSLDATVFENKGSLYYVWAEKVSVGKQISNLYIARMKSANELETAQVLLATPDYSWERHGFWVNEGPSVIHHDGKLFLTFSASDTSPAYCVGMLVADEDSDVLDPQSWRKLRNPVLKSDISKKIYGPGHNCFTTDEDGNDIMVFHARTTDKLICEDPLYDPNRHTMLLKVKWDDGGFPVFNL
ncbi:Beta-xylosidase, GH43 family [Lachnospiraceae bacterium KH1T2]|nr:Beta-xylosidase, GH43 family [Lachnospiraceae bacterium KH1T2]